MSVLRQHVPGKRQMRIFACALLGQPRVSLGGASGALHSCAFAREPSPWGYQDHRVVSSWHGTPRGVVFEIGR